MDVIRRSSLGSAPNPYVVDVRVVTDSPNLLSSSAARLPGFGIVVANAQSWLIKWQVKLNEIALLKPGWNSYSAPAPAKVAVDRVREFLDTLAKNHQEPDRLAPSAIGGVGITHRNRDREVYLEFLNDGGIYALFSVGDDDGEVVKVDPSSQSLSEFTTKVKEFLYD